MTNLAGGYIATRFPPKTVLSVGVTVWSVFTLATPLAAESGAFPQRTGQCVAE